MIKAKKFKAESLLMFLNPFLTISQAVRNLTKIVFPGGEI